MSLFYHPYEPCAKLEHCSLVPKDTNNPLGKLRSGYVIVSGPLTSITDLQDTCHRRIFPENGCTIHLNNARHVRASVRFNDLSTSAPLRDSCTTTGAKGIPFKTLMDTPHIGIVLQAVNVLQIKYKRIGIVMVRRYEVDSLDPFAQRLYLSNYPEPRSVILV
jgi:hypothetical protein